MLSNKQYEVARYITLIALPALATLYAALGEVWGFPHVTEVVASITAIDTALGALLQISTNKYRKGDM